jgi:hypothetical protein
MGRTSGHLVSTPDELEMRHLGCGHRPRELETAEFPDAFEESLTGPRSIGTR